MLFCNIDLIDESFAPRRNQFVGVRDGRIAYIGDVRPDGDWGETYDGRRRLLLPGFYNTHCHAAMTLVRGSAEGLPLDRWLHEKVFPFEAKLTPAAIGAGVRLAIAEMKRLDDNIADPGISADIVRLEQVCQKIFDEVKRDPKKLPQIRRFMDYYLPTTLKLLNSYDRMSGTGVSGENIDSTLAKVEGMMRTVVAAFEKQLDSLYGAEALDISTDITVLETMMAREGLAGEQMKSDPVTKDDTDIKLEL